MNSFVGVAELHVTDVRWERIPLFWRTVGERALAHSSSFKVPASLGSLV